MIRFFLCCFLLLGVACERKQERVAKPEKVVAAKAKPDWKSHKWSGYEVVRELPHDPEAFTQGLLLSGGDWIESTGGYGATSIRRVEKETGKILLKKDLPEKFFGEGLAELDGNFFQLTWQSGKGFFYDVKTLETKGTFAYDGEGWGLTTDGQSLILSDGSAKLRYLDPKTFRVWGEVVVRLNGNPVEMLNELEFVEGEIFANVWHTEKILRIDPKSGAVVGVIDLAGIDAKERRRDPEHVLNGIAYDAETGAMFVTGKCWPKIYQIRLVKVK